MKIDWKSLAKRKGYKSLKDTYIDNIRVIAHKNKSINKGN